VTQPDAERIAQTHSAFEWYAFVPVLPSLKVAGAASVTLRSAYGPQTSPATVF
jgi:hypothetical protein